MALQRQSTAAPFVTGSAVYSAAFRVRGDLVEVAGVVALGQLARRIARRRD